MPLSMRPRAEEIDGVCQPSCPWGQARGADGQCSNPCPGDQFVGGDGECQTPCPEGYVRLGSGGCLPESQCTHQIGDMCVPGARSPEDAVAMCMNGSYLGSGNRDQASCEEALAAYCAENASADNWGAVPPECLVSEDDESSAPEEEAPPEDEGTPPAEDGEAPPPDDEAPPAEETPPAEEGTPAEDQDAPTDTRRRRRVKVRSVSRAPRLTRTNA